MAMETGMLNEAVIVRYRVRCPGNNVDRQQRNHGLLQRTLRVHGQWRLSRRRPHAGSPHRWHGRRSRRTTYPMVQDRHPQIGSGRWRFRLARQEASRVRRGCGKERSRACSSRRSQTKVTPTRWNVLLTRSLDGPEVCGVDAAVLATRVAFAAIVRPGKRPPCC